MFFYSQTRQQQVIQKQSYHHKRTSQKKFGRAMKFCHYFLTFAQIMIFLQLAARRPFVCGSSSYTILTKLNNVELLFTVEIGLNEDF